MRSSIFMVLASVITPIFAVFALLTLPLNRLTRYRFISLWAKSMLPILRVVCGIRHEIKGRENLPAAPCVVMCKHQSAWETLALQVVFPPQVWVLKRELLLIPFFGWALALTSPIAIKRSDGMGAMKQLLQQGKERLAQGFCVVVFPEGTRVPYGQRGKYKVGAAMLAVASRVPVIPVAHNAGRLWGRNSFGKRPGLITLSIGAPIEPAGLSAKQITARAEAWIESEVRNLDQ